jgi:hypothetical protein
MPNSNQTVSRLAACVLVFAGMSAADAQEWQVAKSSGEVWITNSGAQPASLGSDTRLLPGDNIRTGRNGRVLLTRGEERILVSPNSAIGVPSNKNSDLPTTITQQAGTILLDVEKRNVRHFEVETPYLAAIVKGTQFRVSVEKGRSRVEVLRGQVQVADHKSGQHVLVLPGQAARSSAGATGGLQLSGKGRFNAIEQGTPKQSTLRAMSVPRGRREHACFESGVPGIRFGSPRPAAGNRQEPQWRPAHRLGAGRGETGCSQGDEWPRPQWLRSPHPQRQVIRRARPWRPRRQPFGFEPGGSRHGPRWTQWTRKRRRVRGDECERRGQR